MKLLLDTHVWLWQGFESARLGERTRSLIEDRSNAIFLSAASVWELTIKHVAGKMTLPMDVQTYVRTRLVKSGATLLNISLDHIFALGGLDHHHRDPFDRLLVAQTRVESLMLITADERLFDYAVPAFDARR